LINIKDFLINKGKMDQKMDDAVMNIIKVYMAQMNSAVKISEIICKHSNEEELTGDHIISGLIYRLMTPMTDEDMVDSLEKADKLMNGSESDSDELDELEEIEYVKPKSFRKITKNECKCDVCKRVRECLDGYESYETYDPMVTRFKNSIEETCEKHKIII